VKVTFFIVTALKSGTTWLQEICKRFLDKGVGDNPLASVPWLEISKKTPLIGLPVEIANTLPSINGRRFFKSHWPKPTDHVAPNGKTKFVYVMRNGLDVCLSLFHHIRGFPAYGYQGDLPDFFEKFMRGESDFGSWFAHVKAWWPRRKDRDVLFLHYENILHDTPGSIKGIAAFVGAQLDEQQLAAIVKDVSFDEMKTRPIFYDMIRSADATKWLRSGKSGEGKATFSADQVERFHERCKLEFVGEYADIPWHHDHHRHRHQHQHHHEHN